MASPTVAYRQQSPRFYIIPDNSFNLAYKYLVWPPTCSIRIECLRSLLTLSHTCRNTPHISELRDEEIVVEGCWQWVTFHRFHIPSLASRLHPNLFDLFTSILSNPHLNETQEFSSVWCSTELVEVCTACTSARKIVTRQNRNPRAPYIIPTLPKGSWYNLFAWGVHLLHHPPCLPRDVSLRAFARKFKFVWWYGKMSHVYSTSQVFVNTFIQHSSPQIARWTTHPHTIIHGY